MEKVYIPAFYTGRSIFITGGTGFIGKALIEKLLRSCPDVAEIFMLVRTKKGLSVNDRLKKMLNNKLFDKLRSEQPSCFDKIILITGDMAAENLGLLAADRETLIERVSIIFNVAASVKFDESIKEAILNNTRSTRNICVLAKNMKKLVVLLHISSTYTQIDKPIVEEILYPPEYDWKKMIQIAESIDEHVLRTLTSKILGRMPNTYIFSKRLAEQVIIDYSESLPCVIVRPSIVISSTYDPMKGWIDNFNGPFGMLIGGGKGILHVVLSDASIVPDFIPVDTAVKALIVLAWKHGISENKTIDVYNCSSNKMKAINLECITHIGLGLLNEIPLSNTISKPWIIITKNCFVYNFLVLLLHILPAILLDGIMTLWGVRPMLLKLQRKIYVANSTLSYFLLNEWKFVNTKLINMFDNLEEENKEFEYPHKLIDLKKFYKNGLIGAKICLLKENMDDLEVAKRQYKRMEWVDAIIRTLLAVMILWILYRKNTFSYIMDIF